MEITKKTLLKKFQLQFIQEAKTFKRTFRNTEEISSFLRKNGQEITKILRENGLPISAVRHRSFPDEAILVICLK